MDWIAQNWVWVLFAVGMIVMHMFGHGGHGGHGSGHDDSRPANKDTTRPASGHRPGHHH